MLGRFIYRTVSIIAIALITIACGTIQNDNGSHKKDLLLPDVQPEPQIVERVVEKVVITVCPPERPFGACKSLIEIFKGPDRIKILQAKLNHLENLKINDGCLALTEEWLSSWQRCYEIANPQEGAKEL